MPNKIQIRGKGNTIGTCLPPLYLTDSNTPPMVYSTKIIILEYDTVVYKRDGS